MNYAFEMPTACTSFPYYVPGITEANFSLKANEYQVFLFPTQRDFSEMFVLIVIFCVPVYLCTKPCLVAC